MLIYLLVILLILLFQNNLLRIPSGSVRDRAEEKYLRIVCWILVLLAALRGSSVGTDTIAYLQYYESMGSYSFIEVLILRADYPGFFVLAKICSLFHMPAQVLLGVVEGIYVYSIYKFTSRFSEEKLYTILCFEMIGLYSFSLAGLKQTLSMAFVLFYFMALIDKKYIQTVVLAVVAFLCHHSSLIFFAGVALYFIRNWKIYYWVLAGIVVLVLLGTNSIWTNMLGLLDNDHYSLYLENEGYSNTTMIFYGVLLLMLFLFSGNYRNQRKDEARVVLGMSTLAFVFQAFSLISSAAFRLSYYFLPLMIVGFPNAFNKIGNKDTERIVKHAVAFMIVFMFVYSNRNGGSVVPYKFFWQE